MDFFSATTGNTIVNHTTTSNNISVLSFHQICDELLISDIHGVKTNVHTSIQDKINELDKLIITDDRDDSSILSEIDPDLNMLFDMNDTIHNSSRYLDASHFRKYFVKYKNDFSILNANIRGMAANLDKLKLLIDDLEYTFPIIGITETCLKAHNVDCHFINGHSHEYDIRPNRTGGGVSLFIANSIMYTRRRDIHINSVFNSVIIDIDKSEVNSRRNISVIILYRPPNTDSTIFMKDMEEMFTILTSENRDIFMIGDFNYDTFKNSIYQLKSMDSEHFTNILAGFNMYKLIHKPTRIKPPSATLLDNIYTNIHINIHSCKSGILTSNISDHFFVFGIFDHMKINQSKNTFNTRYFTEKYISKFAKILNNNSWENLDLNNNAQYSFTLFYNFFVNNFENVFPEKAVEIKYKNRHPWMAKSLLKSKKKS